ncbi:hypothetical protein DERF_014648 [Dermatophagoides farinae]|uniref:Uncharacterized protein n=1 Tax=Dermatophagoides farinae TaxID=6954 RepID=A0A922HIY2_DERFA|nr:hypothetical protein DERF_014648 [Dermatophagoides farinae]
MVDVFFLNKNYLKFVQLSLVNLESDYVDLSSWLVVVGSEKKTKQNKKSTTLAAFGQFFQTSYHIQ